MEGGRCRVGGRHFQAARWVESLSTLEVDPLSVTTGASFLIGSWSAPSSSIMPLEAAVAVVNAVWHVGDATRWISRSASTRSTRRWRASARPRSPIPTRARNSPAPPSPARWRAPASGSRWTVAASGFDNVFIERLWRSLKYEDVYLKGYAHGREARAGIAAWIGFYNGRRPHQALAGRTPMAVWRGRHRRAGWQRRGHDTAFDSRQASTARLAQSMIATR
jgi:Integrase core domain